MSYLQFDKTIMTNLSESLEREVLRCNALGAYMCTTIAGCNTRKYHGLLVVPAHDDHTLSHVLLSSLDETVIQHGAEFNLAVHRYADGTIAPNGHKYVREHNSDGPLRTVYRVGGVVLSREVLFCRDRARLLIRYRILEAHSRTRLRLKPLVAFRSTKELTYQNGTARLDYETVPNGVALQLYDGLPSLYLQLSTSEVSWHHEPVWYRGVRYDREEERGHDYTEDLPMPGTFECEIERGRDLIFAAGTEPSDPLTLIADFEELERSTPRIESFADALKQAADQYYYQPCLSRATGAAATSDCTARSAKQAAATDRATTDGMDHSSSPAYLLSGYPWFGVRWRDQMIGLTACSYGIGKPERYTAVMTTALDAIWRYLDHGVVDPLVRDIESPDSLLWLVNTIQDYYRWEGATRTAQLYGDTVRRAIDYLMDSRVPGLTLRENGLLYATAAMPSKPISWMDYTLDGYPVVDRQGYLVEYNALWYSALCFYRSLLDLHEERLDDFIDRVEESFVRTFVNAHDYLFDYVAEGREQDWNVRPNQIFAVGLTYSPLSRKLQRSVLDIVTKELLTPKGLRSLSPKSPYYRSYCRGVLHDRYYAYLQGGVWSWLLYFYLSAYLKLFKRGGVPFVDRLLIPFEEEMRLHGVGQVSELYDGAPPFRGRSGISFMMSAVAILRISNRLEEFHDYDTDDIFDLELSLTSHHRSSPDSAVAPIEPRAASMADERTDSTSRGSDEPNHTTPQPTIEE